MTLKKSWLIAAAMVLIAWALVRERAPGTAAWLALLLVRLALTLASLWALLQGARFAVQVINQVSEVFMLGG